ncbi:alkaline phosphatase [Ignatzschineria ureiclastica]|uniref:Alkaline phosphatase n=1 Tax=Ignatzschineria ureiclastica TaxID=472582 RepID=A0A2U2AFN1_9GAMM|nr:alkaline phosphatase [Ignatzschineria ureiclastica]PWD81450.1 alkaline phosphatase [Ignatzschineria ureiclastica]GHA00782.1 alkaline phosphatase [Ignatzschineria ureiclastica]
MKKLLTQKPLQTAVLTALLMVSGNAMADDAVLFDRAAKGNVIEKGGATRLKGDQVEALKAEMKKHNVKNVILFIGDGMGDSEITVARNFAEGAGGFFKGIDALPFTGQYTHYALDPKTKLPNYVTDSAASATAWSSGVKTFNGALGIDVNGNPFPTLLELAKEAGLATGNVSTAEIQDATPAAQFAHVPKRKCYGPEATSTLCPESALENGGLGSITEQLIETRADITLGGGAKSFKEVAKAGQYAGKTLTESAEDQGYIFVYNNADMKALTQANQDQPVIGLFAEGNMPVRWKGPKAVEGGALLEPVECEVNSERTAEIPTLAEMTEVAIDLLSQNENGFFLQVEGASIDKQDHAANACGQIGETVDLDEAVQVGLEFAKKHGDTLIIVTADHAHSSQIIPAGANAPGLTQTLITKEGSPMTINYSNSMTESQNHTGSQLRIAAFGPQAANVTGLLDQTDLFFIIQDALELDQKND